jgi:hypothetical protein
MSDGEHGGADDPARGLIDPTRVSLREIKPTTVRTITALAVSAEQRRFVATNAESLAEALFHPRGVVPRDLRRRHARGIRHALRRVAS